MEDDDNGLELSLGLSCGVASGKPKIKDTGSADNRADEDDHSNKAVDGFKDFLNSFIHNSESNINPQKVDVAKPAENFFNGLSKAAGDADASANRIWRPAELEEETRSETGNKRKSFFPELTSQKKHEGEQRDNFHGKIKASHLSLTTEEGSTAENEDVAESEVRYDGSKRLIGSFSSVEAPKDVCPSQSPDQSGQNTLAGTDGSSIGKINHNIPFSVQSLNAMNLPYTMQVKDPNSFHVSSGLPGHLNPSTVKSIPSTAVDRSGAQSVGMGNIPMMFGYPAVQLPLLDKDGSQLPITHSQPFHLHYPGRATQNHANDPRVTEKSKGEEKHVATEEGSSNQPDDAKGSSTNLKAKDMSDGLSFDFSAIKPGVAADLKFGGSGSCPNLPWVSTTGSGPHGRTISGVTYRYNANQIRIVCACHGSHLSPEEFVRHASEEYVSPEAGTSLNMFTNPAASAHG